MLSFALAKIANSEPAGKSRFYSFFNKSLCTKSKTKKTIIAAKST
jgi:hypothetical protein